MSSAIARVPGLGYASFYTASKHALGALTDALAMEVGTFGIRVHAVELGSYATEIYANADLSVDEGSPYASDQRWAYGITKRLPAGDPADAAERIVQVAEDNESATHTIVGRKAEGLVKIWAKDPTLESWLPALTHLFESLIGPRPVAPKYPRTPGRPSG